MKAAAAGSLSLSRAVRHQPMSFRRCYGKEFTDQLFGPRKRAATGEHAFEKLYSALDIDHHLKLPKLSQTNGMIERFNGQVENILQGQNYRSGEALETTLHRYVWLVKQQLPQFVLCSMTPRGR